MGAEKGGGDEVGYQGTNDVLKGMGVFGHQTYGRGPLVVDLVDSLVQQRVVEKSVVMEANKEA